MKHICASILSALAGASRLHRAGRSPGLLTIALLLCLCAGPVFGAAELTLYDGVNPLITVVDNGPGDSLPLTGGILVQTNVGVWNLSISTALTKPLFGSATSPVMDIDLQANSTAAGSLTLQFSDNGFGPASGNLVATITGHTVAGAAGTASLDVYGDPANVVGAPTVHIAGIPTTPLPVAGSDVGGLALGAPFSLTEVETLIASGATTLTTDASFQVVPVPEPGVLGSLALGLIVLALRLRK
ncbi:MAG TPA: PEP-CTERM sorting domain-containing protein [Candidatus Acidoferrum sp.]|nr:PEP-CTERM sorting domain-containing protein [Candidatus Acidoferrum sp.]